MRITTPVKGFTGIVAGVHFRDGVGETDDAAALAYFERQGYSVDGAGSKQVEVPEGDPSEKWTNAQLEAYASEKGIDLDGASKKADILAAIEKGPESPAGGSDN